MVSQTSGKKYLNLKTKMSLSDSDAEKNLKLARRFSETFKMTLGVHSYHAGEIYDGGTSEDSQIPISNSSKR